jgi:hypothetical protein
MKIKIRKTIRSRMKSRIKISGQPAYPDFAAFNRAARRDFSREALLR